MSERDDGGPAFPLQNSNEPGGLDGAYGLSIRDWFAGQALIGIIGTIPGPGCASWDYYSEGAYKIADAMLTERAKR